MILIITMALNENINRIKYTDVNGDLTEVLWYIVNDGTLDYINRVEDTGGIIDDTGCFYNQLSDLMGYNDFCSGKTPLIMKWHGEQYDHLLTSSITFQVLVENDEQRSYLDQQLLKKHYCMVRKNGKIIWLGKLFPQFFVEPYRQYPYVISMDASDQLGQFKEYRMLLTDFPEPFNRNEPRYNLMDIMNILLTEKYFNPLGELPSAPRILNFYSRLWVNSEEYLFEDMHIDPLLWVDDKDQYTNKKDIIESILAPLHMKLFQWEGEWWLISKDAWWDKGSFTYQKYELNRENGYTRLSGKFGTELDADIIDLYEKQYISYPNNKQVYNNAEQSYLPAWQVLIIEHDFQKNMNLIPAFANKTGSFYDGNNYTHLEFGVSYNTGGDWTTDLRHWNYSDDSLQTESFSENSGWLSVPRIPLNAPDDANDKHYVYIDYDLPPITFDYINYTAFLANTTWAGFTGIYIFELISNGKHYWLENKNFPSGMEPEWVNEFRTFLIPVNGQEASGHQFDITVPNPFGTSYTSVITQHVLIKAIDTFFNPPGTRGLIKNFKMNLIRSDWEFTDYNYTSEIIINPDGTKKETKVELNWGISNPNLIDIHDIHLSVPLSSTGDPYNVVLKHGSTGDFPDYRSITEWLALNYVDDNITNTPVLKASFKSRDITPLNLIYDFEGRIYNFTNGEFNDKLNTWSNNYTEYYGIKNIPDRPIKCDFSELDFNDDFCIEWSTQAAADYAKRVSDAGGILDDKGCLEAAMLELMVK